MASAEVRRAPASIGQRQLWLMERRDGANGALNIFNAFRLRGPLQEGALLEALRDLLARHEGLRTTFCGRGPGLSQVVHPPYPMPDRVVKQADIPATRLDDAVRTQARRRFNLGAEWPCRMRLFRIDRDDHLLTISVHHIVADGWSMNVLMDDLQRLYSVHLGDQVESPAPPAWHQADFALWQQRCAEDGSLAKRVAYWREALGESQPISLPSVLRQPSEDQEHEPGVVLYDVPDQAGRLFRETALRYRSTFFTVFLAAFAGYLAACTGQEKVVVPVFFANRTRKQARRTVGYLSNLVLLPIDVAGHPPFPELVYRTRHIVTNAFANQDVPYQVVPPPDGGSGRRRHPELVLEYLNTPGNLELKLAGLEAEAYYPEVGAHTRFAVELHVIARSDGLKLVCFYAPHLTCSGAILRFFNGFIDFALRLNE
ncbi:MAG TPA: condensation domain-containing protein [Streptosporangiaceae bacterium]|nr:condensation domain-containing protein [Streptosporangiaceae bacterium]